MQRRSTVRVVREILKLNRRAAALDAVRIQMHILEAFGEACGRAHGRRDGVAVVST